MSPATISFGRASAAPEEHFPSAAAAPFRKVLVANRGEIAVRVIRTLRAMGIASVAIHHPVEARAKHVRLADEAVEITGQTPVAAHLDGAQIVEAALRAGADAVHPGYGFLSENAGFARRVAEAGLVFIGPDADTIALMGDKISARDFAAAHGVPVAPSVMPTGDLDAFAAAAAAIGFPLLIKAAAGGGGKGMSIVRAAGDLAEAARIAASEAERYFGDGRATSRCRCSATAPAAPSTSSSASARCSAASRRSSRRRRRRTCRRRPAPRSARPPSGSPPRRATRTPAPSSSSSAPTGASSSSK